MSNIRVNSITDRLGTGSPDFPNGITIDTVTVSGKIVHTGDTDTSIGFPINDTITMDTAGTERLRIDSAGAITASGDITASGGINGASVYSAGNITASGSVNGAGVYSTVYTNSGVNAIYSYSETTQLSTGTQDAVAIKADSVLYNGAFNNTNSIGGLFGVNASAYAQGNAGTTIAKAFGVKSDISTTTVKILDATSFQGTLDGVFGTYYGFRQEPPVVGSTTDIKYAFYSNFASAANTFNFYANGTAPNYFAGNVSIGTTTSTSTLNVNGTIGGTVIATQAEAEAGTDNTKLMTPLRVDQSILSNLNAAGSAPLYACRAWVNFNGTGVVAIRGGGNVSSITDNGNGLYRVNFTTALQDTNYAITIATNNDTDSSIRNTIVSIRPAIYSTTQVGVLMYDNGGGVNIDKLIVCVSVFR